MNKNTNLLEAFNTGKLALCKNINGDLDKRKTWNRERYTSINRAMCIDFLIRFVIILI